MKKNIIIAFFIGIAFLASSCSKNNEAQTNAINDFVSTYFPNVEILSSVQDGADYEVILTDYTKIEFDGSVVGSKLVWEQVDCEHSTIYTTVPTALVPEEISTYVATNYPNSSIIKITKDRSNWEIELNNGIDLEFDSNFTVIEID